MKTLSRCNGWVPLLFAREARGAVVGAHHGASRVLVTLLSLILLLAVAVSSAPAQATGIMRGRVVNDRNDAPVAEVTVRIATLQRTVVTDSAGRFVVPDIGTGRHTVVLSKPGWTLLSTFMTIGAGDNAEYVIGLQPAPAEVAGVTVSARAPDRRLVTFEAHRQAKLGGSFLTADQLAKQTGRTLADVLAPTLGADLVRGRSGAAFFATRRGYDSINLLPRVNAADRARGAAAGFCYAAVVLDGIVVYRGEPDELLFDLNQLAPATVLAVEVYNGGASMPAEYNATRSTCGLLVIWTK